MLAKVQQIIQVWKLGKKTSLELWVHGQWF